MRRTIKLTALALAVIGALTACGEPTADYFTRTIQRGDTVTTYACVRYERHSALLADAAPQCTVTNRYTVAKVGA